MAEVSCFSAVIPIGILEEGLKKNTRTFYWLYCSGIIHFLKKHKRLLHSERTSILQDDQL
jgi:hypothetical protein